MSVEIVFGFVLASPAAIILALAVWSIAKTAWVTR